MSPVLGVFSFTSAISSTFREAIVRKSAFVHTLEALMNNAIPTDLVAVPLLVWNYGSIAALAFIAGGVPSGIWMLNWILERGTRSLSRIEYANGVSRPVYVYPLNGRSTEDQILL